jgi:hypothetical protein
MKQGARMAAMVVGSLVVTAVACVVLVKLDIQCLPAQLYPPDKPGDQSNPKLVAMFNEQIDGLDDGELNPARYPYLIPEAAANARLWLAEVREVVTHCRYGAPYKYNYFQFDVVLRSGEVLEDLHVSRDVCNDERQTAMRVTFEAGRVVEVKTDGSELERPLDHARAAVARTVEALVDHDRKVRPARYYKPEPVQPTPAQEWAQP